MPEVEVDALVVLHVTFGEDFVSCECVKGGEDVFEPQDGAEEFDELFFLFFAEDVLSEREAGDKVADEFGVAWVVFSVFVVAVVVCVVVFE